MLFIDFHTHHAARDGERAIRDGVDTWGIHPWHIPSEGALPTPPTRGEQEAGVLLVGECGLDRCAATPYERQVAVFGQMIALSERWQKPLLVHCVRALDDVLRLRHQTRATQPWVVHGFRGKPQQLRSLLAAGLYVSFGFRHNVESLRLCPLERMLLESDTDPRPIHLLYNIVAQERGIALESLTHQIARTAATLLGEA